jgi:hypothetical protein
MAIQPIDLQTLFSQMEKVGKEQSGLKEGAQLQRAILGATEQKKLDEKVKSISETPDTGEGMEKITDKQGRRERKDARDFPGREGSDSTGENPAGDQTEVVKDPALGKNVDLSG